MNYEYKTLLLSSSSEIENSFTQISKELDCSYYNASSIFEGLDHLIDYKVDVIFIDISITQKEILKFLSHISEDIENENTPIVIISNQNNDSLAQESSEFNIISIISNSNWGLQVKKLLQFLISQHHTMLSLAGSLTQSEKRSVVDPLTGAYNRYGAEDIFNTLVARKIAYDEAFCLIMIDIDHFKKINDTYGHDIGDDVLKEFSQLIMNSIRKEDSLIRLGGEEFVIFFSKANIQIGIQSAETIRKKIQDQVHTAKALNITASFGVVEHQNREDLESLVKRADELLYIAKQNGRNRVISTEL